MNEIILIGNESVNTNLIAEQLFKEGLLTSSFVSIENAIKDIPQINPIAIIIVLSHGTALGYNHLVEMTNRYPDLPILFANIRGYGKEILVREFSIDVNTDEFSRYHEMREMIKRFAGNDKKSVIKEAVPEASYKPGI